MTTQNLSNTTTVSACALLIVGGGALVWGYPEQAAGQLLLLLAIVCANLSAYRQAIFPCALVASAIVLTPVINGTPLVTTGQPMWVALYCLVAAMLAYKHNKNLVSVTELANYSNHSGMGLIVADLGGNILGANQPILELLNHHIDQVTQIPLEVLENLPLTQDNIRDTSLANLPNLNIWRAIEVNQNRLKHGHSIQLELRILSDQHAAPLIFECTIKQTKSAQPQHAHYVVQFSNTSEELEAGAILEEEASQLRRILAHGSDMVLFVNEELNITFANTKACDNLQTEDGHLIGQPAYNCIKIAERKRFIQSMQTFVKSGLLDGKIPEFHLQGHNNISVGVSILKLSGASAANYAIILKSSVAQLQSIQASRVTAAKFSEVFHNSPDAILIIRAEDELIVDFNGGFTNLLGYTRETAIGESGLDNTFWNNPVERAAVIEQLINEKEVIGYETTMRTAQGKLIHVEISLRYIEIDNELCILCIGRDITKRISAEAALFESEEKFEKIFNQSPDGILLLRQSDGVITDANNATLDRSGYTLDEVVGSSITDSPIFISKGDLSGAASELAHKGAINNRELVVASKDGTNVPTLISANAFELSGETHVMVISKDISKQRAAENRLRRSEERFRGIFENAPIGIMLLDIDGQIFQANHMAARLLAYDEQHMNGIHVSQLVPVEERPSLKEGLRSMTIEKSTHKSEKRMICQDGAEVWVNFNIVLQKNSDNDPDYYIVQIADISDIKQSEQRLEQMAFYDTLTNLANRRLFHDRLTQSIEHCVRTNKSSALLYLDLDNFKRVNDTLGHQTGDNLLREVAARLKQCVRQEDTVGRTGGDEFTILLNEINSPTDAGLVAQKILNHLREPINISGHPLIVTTSIGITVVPGNGLDPNVLMQNADLAMYKAKERGRNNYQFYSDDLNVNAVKKLQTEYQIRQGLENDEFELYYQPKVSIQTGKVVGVESLIRWNHPERGLLFPDEFIPIAEDTGSIIDMGSWIIEAACTACQQISEQHGHNIQVAINISPRQFRDPNLITTVRRCLREASLNPENIEIEITETMLMHDVEAAQTTIERLAEIGVGVAIDDFGTGYSSLNYLKRFPISTVKVDRSFVMDIPSNTDDMAITRAVIAMAHQLKMQVVAEGVETQEQLSFLAEHNCEYAQGWLFSKAIRLDDLFDYLAEERNTYKLASNDQAN